MANTFLLIHSPLVGPLSWGPVAETLRGSGRGALVPDYVSWTDEPAGQYRRLAATAANIASHEPAGSIVLVGHSGAGGLLPLIAEALQGRVGTIVFVDAILPHPGRSWFDTVPSSMADELRAREMVGFLPPWTGWITPAQLTRAVPEQRLRDAFAADVKAAPVSFLDEPAPEVPEWPPRRMAYLQLSASYAPEAAEAERRGWEVQRRAFGHLGILNHPEQVAKALIELTSSLAEAS